MRIRLNIAIVCILGFAACLPSADKPAIVAGVTLACEGGLSIAGVGAEPALCVTVAELAAALATLNARPSAAPSASVGIQRAAPSTQELRAEILRMRSAGVR